jgi:enoyl-CoA hydratase/carnithine racemase
MSQTPIQIPESYESLELPHIKITRHPLNSPTATPIVLVTLNRPEKNNAFTPQMANSLEFAYRTFHVDPRVKVVVLTGAGRMFCAGSDLEIGFGNGEGRAGDFRDMYDLVGVGIRLLANCSKWWSGSVGYASLS